MVVGYGTMRKKDVTGSIAKVNMDEKATFANTNVLQSLQGAIPGLNIGMTTGAGTEPEMTVRSTTSISASNNPLVVVMVRSTTVRFPTLRRPTSSRSMC